MSDSKIYPIPEAWRGCAYVDPDIYASEYRRSIDDPDGFWSEKARALEWHRFPKRIREVLYGPEIVNIRWFGDGLLNASHNCIDRHLATRGDKVAILWEGDESGQSASITYRQAS